MPLLLIKTKKTCFIKILIIKYFLYKTPLNCDKSLLYLKIELFTCKSAKITHQITQSIDHFQ